MKVVKELETGLLRKVSNEEAKKAVSSGNYTYSSKSTYKSQINKLVKLYKNHKFLKKQGGVQVASDQGLLSKDKIGNGYYGNRTIRKVAVNLPDNKVEEKVDLKYKSLEKYREIITSVEKISKGNVKVTAIIDGVTKVLEYPTVKEVVEELKLILKK